MRHRSWLSSSVRSVRGEVGVRGRGRRPGRAGSAACARAESESRSVVHASSQTISTSQVSTPGLRARSRRSTSVEHAGRERAPARGEQQLDPGVPVVDRRPSAAGPCRRRRCPSRGSTGRRRSDSASQRPLRDVGGSSPWAHASEPRSAARPGRGFQMAAIGSGQPHRGRARGTPARRPASSVSPGRGCRARGRGDDADRTAAARPAGHGGGQAADAERVLAVVDGDLVRARAAAADAGRRRCAG